MKILPLNDIERTVTFSVCCRWQAAQGETEKRRLNRTWRAWEVRIYRTLVRYQLGANEIDAQPSLVVLASATFQIIQKALLTTSESAWTWASGVGLHEGTSCQYRKRSSLASLSICCVLLKPGNQTDVFPGNTLTVSPCQTHQRNLFLPVRLWWLPTMSQLTYLKS